MRAFNQHTGVVGPMDRANVDTDVIVPKQYLKSIQRSGFGAYLFDGDRYLDEGWIGKPEEDRELNPDFPLNQPRFKGASILLARENFGCGSSREHAPWALEDSGFRVIIAPSFADIFFNNCFKNGLLPIVLDEDKVDLLFRETEAQEGYSLSIDLETQQITTPAGQNIPFAIDDFRKHCLMNGLDDIGLTLDAADKIRAFEEQRANECPWVFGQISPQQL